MMQSNKAAPDHGTSVGERLRQAREQQGLPLQRVASQLRVPTRVLAALEADDTTQLGAPIFVRGHLRSYAALIGIDIESDLASSSVAPIVPPELVSHSHTPRYRRLMEQMTRRAVYIVLTATIAIPVWLGMSPHLDNSLAVQSLELPTTVAADAVSNQSAQAVADTRPAPRDKTRGQASASSERTPLMASMASLSSASSGAKGLTLRFKGDSWVQVFSRDGSSLEQGMLSAGETRTYQPGEVERVVLGNIEAVDVRKDGKPVDLAGLSRANVARFTLSSDGSLERSGN